MKKKPLTLLDILLIVIFLLLLIAPLLFSRFAVKLIPIEDKLIEHIEGHWEEKLQDANELIQKEKFEKAITAYSRILEQIPCDKMRCKLSETKRKAYVGLASTYVQHGEIQKAIDVFTELNEFAPRNYEYYFYQAFLEKERGNMKASLDLVEIALDYYPDYLFGVKLKLDLLYEMKEIEDYISYYEYFDNKNHFFKPMSGLLFFSPAQLPFNRAYSVKFDDIVLDGNTHTYSIDLSTTNINDFTSPVQKIRIDPVNEKYDFSLNKITLYKDGKSVTSLDDFSIWKVTNVESFKNGRFQSLNNDPYIASPVFNIDLRNVDRIDIEMTIYPLSSHYDIYTSLIKN